LPLVAFPAWSLLLTVASPLLAVEVVVLVTAAVFFVVVFASDWLFELTVSEVVLEVGDVVFGTSLLSGVVLF